MIKQRVLLVEDNQTVRKIISYSLMRVGINVIEASDGVEALEKVYSEKPDLVLLDINIPKLNGYAVCTQIKSDHQTQHIPVIFCTSKNDKNEYDEAKKYGADGYLNKPFKHSDIIPMIKNLGMKKIKIYQDKYKPNFKQGCVKFLMENHQNYQHNFVYS